MKPAGWPEGPRLPGSGDRPRRLRRHRLPASGAGCKRSAAFAHRWFCTPHGGRGGRGPRPSRAPGGSRRRVRGLGPRPARPPRRHRRGRRPRPWRRSAEGPPLSPPPLRRQHGRLHRCRSRSTLWRRSCHQRPAPPRPLPRGGHTDHRAHRIRRHAAAANRPLRAACPMTPTCLPTPGERHQSPEATRRQRSRPWDHERAHIGLLAPGAWAPSLVAAGRALHCEGDHPVLLRPKRRRRRASASTSTPRPSSRPSASHADAIAKPSEASSTPSSSAGVATPAPSPTRSSDTGWQATATIRPPAGGHRPPAPDPAVEVRVRCGRPGRGERPGWDWAA